MESRRPSARSSDPSTATARLRVTGLTCRLAGPLPWTRARSCSAYSQRVDRLAHVCSLTEDVARVLQAAAHVNSGLKSMGASWLLLSRWCPSHASLRLEANFIAPSDVFPSPCSSRRLPLTPRSTMPLQDVVRGLKGRSRHALCIGMGGTAQLVGSVARKLRGSKLFQ